ncbi:MAG: hypothetical protein KC425_27555, partial [Anaerolineales bacterium]|nr:hypothetical protein [Anaerolineales bacterium]
MLPIDTLFDVTFANAIARLESYNKHHYRPNSYLHKWWARRCGSTFRLILKHLVADEAARDYYAPGGLNGRIILDPMMGGGTTLHEAIRLGANVIGADIDPIPVLQLRATLAELPLAELEPAYRHFHKALRAGLDGLYETHCPICDAPTQLKYVLYGLRRRCACGPALFVDSCTLRHEADGSMVCLDPATHAVCRVGADGRRTVLGETAVAPRLPLYAKEVRRCPSCAEPFMDEREVPYYARYVPLVIAGRCPEHKRFFRAPGAADLALLAQADRLRAQLAFDRTAFAVEPGRKSRQLISKGVDNYLDLFSSRQLQVLSAAMRLLPAYEPLIRLNLALLVSTSLEFNSMLCGYKGAARRRAGAIRHTFSHHAYAFPHMALENNPLFRRRASGTLHKLFRARIVNGRKWAQLPRERKVPGKTAEFVSIPGEVDGGEEVRTLADLQQGSRRFLLMQGSSTALDLPDGSVDAIVTDPPYFDSVQYSDLAAFFRVWLRQLLPDAADWGYDVADSAVDPHKNDRESRYAVLLAEIFAECRRVLRPDGGRFIFTFHHWNPKGWAALTLAL